MQIVSGGVTNVGRVRTNNEDSFRIVEPMNLYILSDGMGGEAHGEIASAMAVEVVAQHCAERRGGDAIAGAGAVAEYGKRAALLEKERDGVFTVKVGNS